MRPCAISAVIISWSHHFTRAVCKVLHLWVDVFRLLPWDVVWSFRLAAGWKLPGRVWPCALGRVPETSWPYIRQGWPCSGLAPGRASLGQNLSGGGHSEPQCLNHLFNELLNAFQKP